MVVSNTDPCLSPVKLKIRRVLKLDILDSYAAKVWLKTCSTHLQELWKAEVRLGQLFVMANTHKQC
jgi:hypothetical protein